MSDSHDDPIDHDLAEGFAQLRAPEDLVSKLMMATQPSPMDHAWGYGSERRLREENQDGFGVFDFGTYTLTIVCDGMGGAAGGAYASSLAVRTLHDTLRELSGMPLAEAIEEALKRTNLVVYEAARKNHRLMGMGTTAVVVAVKDGVAHVAHVGDSRAYRIRNGQVQQLTRDHTMVNLFVDAELLTPEDAATHPEAHVLSRSLGVERQVDIEVAEPIPLEPNDVLLLCSDGVHGVVTDWELANVDWSAPHEGVRHVLGIVGSREGDDNATAVAISMARSFEDVPTTPVPRPESMDDTALGASLTAVPFDDEDSSDVSYGHIPESGGASFVAQDEQQLSDPPRTPTQTGPQPPVPAPRVAHVPQQGQRRGTPTPAPPQTVAVTKKKRSVALRLVPIVLAGSMLAAAGLGALLLLTSSGDEEMASTAPAPANPATVKVEQAAPAAVEPSDLGEPAVAMADADIEGETVQLFKPEIPDAPRRLPHRSTRYTQPPPGGQVQFSAVSAARNKECAKALHEVQRGMEISIDYARLYNQAWLCFADAHQRPLEQAHVVYWEDFRYIVPHFEGTPEERRGALEEDPELKNLPEWYRPAVDGVEFRLERYAESNDNDKLVDVLNDQFGEPTVADQLAVDLHLVALAAEGLSRVNDPSDEAVQWWARRVYVATRALNGRVGRTIDRHRHEMIPVIRELLKEASEPRQLHGGGMSTVPEVVLLARDVGLAKVALPAKTVATKEVYVAPTEPTLEELEVDEPATVIR